MLYRDGHMHLENGPLTKEYVLQFVEAAYQKGLDEIQILDHTHRFIEFEPIYEDLKVYDVQKTWLENKTMKFKDHISDYIDLMKEHFYTDGIINCPYIEGNNIVDTLILIPKTELINV